LLISHFHVKPIHILGLTSQTYSNRLIVYFKKLAITFKLSQKIVTIMLKLKWNNSFPCKVREAKKPEFIWGKIITKLYVLLIQNLYLIGNVRQLIVSHCFLFDHLFNYLIFLSFPTFFIFDLLCFRIFLVFLLIDIYENLFAFIILIDIIRL
jgi:hypothetical protein